MAAAAAAAVQALVAYWDSVVLEGRDCQFAYQDGRQ